MAVAVIFCTPRSLQSKSVWLRPNVMPLQISLLLAVMISVGDNVPLPSASRLRTKVVPVQLTVGVITSI